MIHQVTIGKKKYIYHTQHEPKFDIKLQSDIMHRWYSTTYKLTLRTRRYQTLNIDIWAHQMVDLFNIYALQSTIFGVVNRQLPFVQGCRKLQQHLVILGYIWYITIWNQVRNSGKFSPRVSISIFLHKPNILSMKNAQAIPQNPQG